MIQTHVLGKSLYEGRGGQGWGRPGPRQAQEATAGIQMKGCPKGPNQGVAIGVKRRGRSEAGSGEKVGRATEPGSLGCWWWGPIRMTRGSAFVCWGAYLSDVNGQRQRLAPID